jgi:hypothetical protein
MARDNRGVMDIAPLPVRKARDWAAREEGPALMSHHRDQAEAYGGRDAKHPQYDAPGPIKHAVAQHAETREASKTTFSAQPATHVEHLYVHRPRP